jgi:hypothetical protein
MPVEFNRQKIIEWRSSVFEVMDEIESYSLSRDSDGNNWEFTDKALRAELPNIFKGDFLFVIVNVPLELNWYVRRFEGNKVVFTFHEIKDILMQADIPLENAILRVLNAYTLVYRRSGNRIPNASDNTNFTHDETRGCLFDMNGLKADIVHSCHKPIICSDCIERLKGEKVSSDVIARCQADIRKIRKPLFYLMSDFIKRHPLWALLISLVTAIALNIVAAIIYDWFKR